MRHPVLFGFVLLLAMPNAAYAQHRRGGASGPLAPSSGSSALEAAFSGTVTSITKSDLGIQADGGNVLSFSILHKTKFLKDGKTVKWSNVHTGDTVSIQAGEDPTGHPAAITVTIGKPPADQSTQPST